MTVIEKIFASHSNDNEIQPGDIVDIFIDTRVARDFGGANVINHLQENHLKVQDPEKTFFTFDCNPTGSDQNYAANQHRCRMFARKTGIRVYDIDKGIGTHVLIEEGLAYPGSTAVSTDSHANILGAVGAFGQGMGDKDIAAAWHKGTTWFKVPPTVKIFLNGDIPPGLTAKDISLNLLDRFGAHTLLGCAVEIEGDRVEDLTMDQRMTISSMATELGAIIIFFPPNQEVLLYCESRSMKKLSLVLADRDATYKEIYDLDLYGFTTKISLPGKPHDTAALPENKIWIDSAFIGSCTNGRIEDLHAAAEVLKNRKIAPGVVLKIVPATNRVWQQCLDEGLFEVFKEAGAMISNAGCAGCASGQVGQNGPGEVTVSTGNRNFPGKQGQGDVYLASPQVVAASAIAGYITDPRQVPDKIPDRPLSRQPSGRQPGERKRTQSSSRKKVVEGTVWNIPEDNIDTDMIYHNRYLSETRFEKMGPHTFKHVKGLEDFASKVGKGDIIVSGKNFGAGSSRQQAVDCFLALGIQCIIAESFGAIYERNAINAAMPILQCKHIPELDPENGQTLRVNFETGEIRNVTAKKSVKGVPFSDIQMEIYQNNGLF